MSDEGLQKVDLGKEGQSTETIDLTSLFTEDVTASGSFDLGALHETAVGKLLNALPLPALLVDSSHHVVFANEFWRKTISDSPKIRGASFLRLFPHRDQAAQAQAMIQQTFSDRKPHIGEVTLNLDKRKIWGRMHLRSLRMAGARCVLILLQDLTPEKKELLLTKQHGKELARARKELEKRVDERTAELTDSNKKLRREIAVRKRAEQELKESEEKYRRVVENASDAIVVAQGGKLKLVNPKARDFMGYTGEELTTSNLLDFVHPDDRETLAQRYGKRMKGEPVPSRYPFRVIGKDGETKWVEVKVVSINWEGRPAALTFMSDVTAKRRMEEELVKVQKLESVGILAGGIAHDFNNILTAILGNISLGKMSIESPERAMERLAEAEKACVRAQGLTQQLLTFSKGGAPIRRALSISETIRDSCLFALRGSNVRCRFSLADDLWTVEADEGQIAQVVNNLVINADHAMPDGGEVHVSAENVRITAEGGLPLREGCYVKVVIKDQGLGMDEKILPKIFDPYFTTKHKGSGLGLATSYSIINKHDGLITVASEPGAGTTFDVYLPASQTEMETSKHVEEALPDVTGRVLVMDDEASIRELALEALSPLGYEVQVARNGAEAIELFRAARDASRPFDAVVLDLTVPGGIGGREAIQALREIDPEVKAIVSSGYSNDPVMAEYGKYGFDGVVAKPYAPGQLAATLGEVIRKKDRTVR